MNLDELGRRVFRHRKELGLSQEGLAQKAGISRNYISLIERSEVQNVSMNVLTQLGAALNLSPSELLGQAADNSTMISPSLRRFGIEEDLNYQTVEWLAQMPRRGPEPRTVDEWRNLYEVVRPFLED